MIAERVLAAAALIVLVLLGGCDSGEKVVEIWHETTEHIWHTTEVTTVEQINTTETITVIEEDSTPDYVTVYEYPSGTFPALAIIEEGAPAMAAGPIQDLATEATGLTNADYLVVDQGGTTKKFKPQAMNYPPHHIHGLICSYNAVDPDADVDIAAGGARDTTDAANMVLAASITKRLDASWVVGTNNGGLDAGGIAASTLYAVWLIKRSDTGVVDVLFSTSFTAPTMPTDYALKRLIGAIKTDSTSDIVRFRQSGDQFEYIGDAGTIPPGGADISDASITTDTWETGTLASVPPHCRAHIVGSLVNATATEKYGVLYIRPRPSDALPSFSVSDTKAFAKIAMDAAFDEVVARGSVMVNAAQQIDYAASEIAGAATVYVQVLGFEMLTRRDPL